ncbi:MAG: hypothetical protein WCJ50_06870 [Actinomycetes bacterium]
MDSFALIVIVVIVLLVTAVVLIGILFPGSGADQLDWRQTRSAELEFTNEIDDLEQMEAAVNAKRRARGAAEISHVELKAEIDREMAGIHEDPKLEQEDLAQLLEARNSRRRKRGEAEQTLEEFERSLVTGSDGGAQ